MTSRYSPRAVSRPLSSTRYMPPGRGSSVACCPFHCEYWVESVKNWNTVCGLAATRTSRSITSTGTAAFPPGIGLLRGFGDAFEVAKGGVPEAVEIRAELLKSLGAGSIIPPSAIAPLGQQPCILEHCQMLRDSGAADVKVARDVAGRDLAPAHQPQDVPPAGIGDRLHGGGGGSCGAHAVYLSTGLRKPSMTNTKSRPGARSRR